MSADNFQKLRVISGTIILGANTTAHHVINVIAPKTITINLNGAETILQDTIADTLPDK